jgi:type IV pilus assembly protein PilE
MNSTCPMSTAPKQRGFTLIELMIAVVIVGILAAIAYPSYVNNVTKSRRSAAEAFMLSVANKQEQYLLDARRYATALTDLNLATPAEVSTYYNVVVTADNTATPPGYLITSTPLGTQLSNDAACPSLTLDNTGTRLPATGCW